jgi:hypothetical protein
LYHIFQKRNHQRPRVEEREEKLKKKPKKIDLWQKKKDK